MRRGLMERNPQELPLEVLDARIARLRVRMKSAGLDAFIIYTNLVRPSAVTYLTGFTPYWSEGLLLVPLTGLVERIQSATRFDNAVAKANRPVIGRSSKPSDQ